MPSQQSSFNGTRTVLICHAFIAAMEPVSAGPSKIPRPSAHMYWPPERLTPTRRSAWPWASTSCLPFTLTASDGALRRGWRRLRLLSDEVASDEGARAAGEEEPG